MAQVEEVFRTKLIAHAGLSALVDERIYAITLPQRPTFPAIAFRRVSNDTIGTRDNANGGLTRPRFQFDVWAGSYDSARDTAVELRSALNDIHQATSPRVDVAIVVNEMDGYEAAPGRWRTIVDAYIWHEV